jgi:hypothetical protein
MYKINPQIIDTSIYFFLTLDKHGPIFFTLCYEKDIDTTIHSDEGLIHKPFERHSSTGLSMSFKRSNSKSGMTENPYHGLTKEIYVLVEPSIVLNEKNVNLDSITLQTILSKSLGTYHNWEKYFREANLLSNNLLNKY